MSLLLLFACGEGGDSSKEPGTTVTDTGEPASCETAPSVTWESWGHGFFLTYCNACHSSTAVNRSGAPEGVDFDSRADTVEWKGRIRARVLEEQTMPLGGGVYEEDLSLLEVMLACDL